MTQPTARPLAAPGHTAVDYEERVDFARLRAYRLARARAALEDGECGAFLLFDFYNIRYTTQTWIGGALGDKMTRYALLTRDAQDPWLWDFGSAVRHHQLYSNWLPDENCRPGMLGMRGAVAPSAGLMVSAVAEIAGMLRDAGLADEPVGADIVEPAFLFEMQRQGLHVVDCQQAMLDARVIKNVDEIVLLTQAAAMVDGVYADIVDALRPGVRENEIVALANKRLYEMGSDQVEAVNAISGERCNPHPHNFTDRIIRPGDQAFFDIIHSYNGYRTCYYRTFAVGRATDSQRAAYDTARAWMDAAIAKVKPGVGTDEIAAVWPRATDFGFADELAAFGLQFGHGLGLGLHERPIISRLNSMHEPIELREGMVFALETYCPADDGFSAARIEEEVVVTAEGPRVLTLYPAENLVVANPFSAT
ncbi:M24 family metallopeptidase [Actinospica sp.]|jgi:Xaa-Pro dipeptidase|uniref:M24 family metallopeptidase n=1 Tax=Actinospica sp. TaxID=1872142 RepID=UPI002BF2B938|nr:M24 family metallopeptidase [Actinospica sp.]HWG23669.1 M24 family metallopeptidase [Actinospica sp.]